MYYLTLEHIKTNPLFNKVNAGKLPLATLTRVITDTRDTTPVKLIVDNYAMTFYTLNHLFSELCAKRLPLEPLEDRDRLLVVKYERVVQQQTSKILAYLVLACVRESRHHMENETIEVDNYKILDLFDDIQGKKAKEAVATFLNSDINCNVAEFLDALVKQFNNYDYANGYGGEAWASIADCCLQFATGNISAEVFVDYAYHLEHNNGSVFNKDFIFSSHKPNLKTILDCQAAGQLPNLYRNPAHNMTQFIGEMCLDPNINHLVPEDLPPVDWSKVSAKHKYPNGEKYVKFDKAMIGESSGNTVIGVSVGYKSRLGSRSNPVPASLELATAESYTGRVFISPQLKVKSYIQYR